MNSIKVQYKSEYYIYSENSKTFYPHGLLLNLAGKINLKRCDKYVPLPNLSI